MNFWGGYVQAGYFITSKLQGALRYDFMDRNGLDTGGLLNMPAIGVNYYFFGNNLKLQVMYQYMGRTETILRMTVMKLVSVLPAITLLLCCNLLSKQEQ